VTLGHALVSNGFARTRRARPTLSHEPQRATLSIPCSTRTRCRLSSPWPSFPSPSARADAAVGSAQFSLSSRVSSGLVPERRRPLPPAAAAPVCVCVCACSVCVSVQCACDVCACARAAPQPGRAHHPHRHLRPASPRSRRRMPCCCFYALLLIYSNIQLL
jgi:hypothetical protein